MKNVSISEEIVGRSVKDFNDTELAELCNSDSLHAEIRTTVPCSALYSFVASYLASAQTKCGKDNKK